MKRAATLIEACDAAGVVVILGLLDHAQDQVLKDDAAVNAAVKNAAAWVAASGYGNVIIEVANEFGNKAYDHAALKDPVGVASLIKLARDTAPKTIVAASSPGNGRTAHQVGNASHFILLHFDAIPAAAIGAKVPAASKYAKAIVCNSDNELGEEAANAAQIAADSLCSWGYSNLKTNQHHPFTFKGAADDPVFYNKLKELTSK